MNSVVFGNYFISHMHRSLTLGIKSAHTWRETTPYQHQYDTDTDTVVFTTSQSSDE